MVYTTIVLAIVMLLSSTYGKIKQGNFLPLAGSALVLCIFAGLRDISFGTDLLGYENRYLFYVPYVSYEDILLQYEQGIMKDGLFYIIMKFFSDIDFSYQLFIAFVTSCYIISVALLIKQKPAKPIISFMMFMTLSWLPFSFTGLRQSVAMAICVISLVLLLRNAKSFLALVLIIVAGFVHSSAWIFLIAPLIRRINLKIGRVKFIQLTGICLVISILGNSFFRNLVTILSWNDTLANYANSDISLNWNGFIIQLLFALVSYFFYDAVIKADSDYSFLYSLMAIGVGIQAFSSVVAEMFRVSMYFSIASICVYPTAIMSIARSDYRSIMFYLSILLIVAYFFEAGKFSSYLPIIMA